MPFALICVSVALLYLSIVIRVITILIYTSATLLYLTSENKVEFVKDCLFRINDFILPLTICTETDE